MIWNTPFWELQNLGTSRLFTSPGLFGGYPGSVAYIHNIRDNNLRDLAEAGEAYPVADLLNDIVEEPLVRAGGYVVVPDRPGIGVEIREEKLAKFPYRPHTIGGWFKEDGSVAH